MNLELFLNPKKTYGEREYLHQTVNEISDNSCFSELVNTNKTYINYLRQHFTQNIDYDHLLAIENAEELQSTYTNALRNDVEFKKLMKQVGESGNEERRSQASTD